MKFSKASILTWALVLLAVPLAAQMNPTHAKDCTLATLNGSYAFFERAILIGEPVVQMVTNGIVKFDGSGNSSFVSITNVEGWGVSGAGDPATGTYTVNPDCTYSGELTSPDGTTFHFVGTITGTGRLQETHYLITDPGWVALGTVKRIQPESCSVSTLKGSYSLFGEGTVTAYTPPAPMSHVGIVTYDGAGRFFGSDTIMLNGTLVPDTFTGTYTVSSDCTVSVEITSTAVGIVHELGRITGEGKNREVHLIVTDPGFVFLETTKKQ